MKKVFCFICVLFLSACMVAPKDVFTENLNLGTKTKLPVQSIEVLNLNKHFDSHHYVESKWPQTPVEMIQKWAKENLESETSSDSLVIKIQKAYVVREDLPAPHWWQKDGIKDTLVYQVVFVIQTETKMKYTFTVGGKVFVQMPEKLSLADKEKEWVKLANQMFENLNKQVFEKFKNVV